jgi:glyoxylase-like metal-dependent hydrolase (beta-lactamase superfamily II)
MPEQPDLFELPNGGWDPRVRAFRSRDEVDTFAVLTARYAVLVDTTALPALSAGIVAMLRPALAKRQLLVVNTHADYDHAWGNATFAADGRYPAPIFGHERSRERLHSAAEGERLNKMRRDDPAFDAVRLVPPTITFTGAVRIDGGDLTLELLPTPGHTSDHVAVWIPELRLLLAGDAAEHPFPFIEHAADIPLVRTSLARLVALDPAMILPCHGETTDPGLPLRNLAYLDSVERATRARLASGPLPDDWAARDDLPTLLGLPYEEAVRATGVGLGSVPASYRGFHLRATRAMVGWVLSGEEHHPAQ